jgi:hypothetical protein
VMEEKEIRNGGVLQERLNIKNEGNAYNTHNEVQMMEKS